MGALGGSLAGNMFTTKAVVEMFECVMVGAENALGCESNPFLTVWPYLFIFVSLTLACVSLYMLAIGPSRIHKLDRSSTTFDVVKDKEIAVIRDQLESLL